MPIESDAIDKGLSVDDIVVVARENTGGIIALQTHKVRNLVAVVIEHFCDRLALLHHELAAIKIRGECSCLLPPRNFRVDTCPRNTPVREDPTRPAMMRTDAKPDD